MPKTMTPAQRRERETLLRRLRFARTLAADEELQRNIAPDLKSGQQSFEAEAVQKFVYSGRRAKVNAAMLA